MENAMAFQSMLSIFLPLSLASVGMFAALALGKAVSAAMDATARQPEAAGKILVNMIAGCALIEALAIYALVFAIMTSAKI